jgi:peptide chain release factor 2
LSRNVAHSWSVFDPAKIEAQIHLLSEKAHDPDFWKNQRAAKTILSEKSALEKSFARWQTIHRRYEEAGLLIEMSEQENDSSLAEEAVGHLAFLEGEMDRLYIDLHLCGEKDMNNAIVTIHPGAGGTESADWAQMLTRMYLRWAEQRGYVLATLDLQPGEEAGIKSITVRMSGEYAYGYMRSESGVHRLVRISPFDANKRRHTSFASVFVSPEVEEDTDVVIDEKELRIDTYRSSSAGGQHVNKTDSAVRITHLPTGTVAQCQNERSQLQNKTVAMTMLRSRLYLLQQEQKQAEMAKTTGEKKEIGWGSQIRSYVFQPYQVVKDHRTGFEKGDVASVMDGAIDPFIYAFLKWNQG